MSSVACLRATSLTEVASLGAIVSQLWPLADRQPGLSLHAVDTITADGFFTAVLASPVAEQGERREIAALVAERGVALTYGLIPMIAEGGLNLSAADPALRERSISEVIARLDEARQAGAHAVMVAPGPAPADEAERQLALDRLAGSLGRICAAGADGPALRIVIEPLDVAVHKRQALGYTPEAVRLADTLAGGRGEFRLCLDTAHMLLNGEDPLAAIELAGPRIGTLHFCNCVTTPGELLYGDHHPRIGIPGGCLDQAGVARILTGLAELGMLSPGRTMELLVEEFNYDQDNEAASLAILAFGRELLEAAWQQARAV